MEHKRIEYKGRLYGCDGEKVWEIARGGSGMPDLAGSIIKDEELKYAIIREFLHL